MAQHAKIALVTGAGSGIGKQVALALLGEGYAVVLAGRRKKLLEATAREAGAGGQCLAVATDVSDPSSVKALFAKTKKSFGRLDLLFNNAGVFGQARLLEDLTYEQWNHVVGVNAVPQVRVATPSSMAEKSGTPLSSKS